MLILPKCKIQFFTKVLYVTSISTDVNVNIRAQRVTTRNGVQEVTVGYERGTHQKPDVAERGDEIFAGAYCRNKEYLYPTSQIFLLSLFAPPAGAQKRPNEHSNGTFRIQPNISTRFCSPLDFYLVPKLCGCF
jgi:hypothetical protein